TFIIGVIYKFIFVYLHPFSGKEACQKMLIFDKGDAIFYLTCFSIDDVITIDSDNDGNVVNDGSADARITITDTDTGSFIDETKTDTILLPIGLEMRPWKKFAVRLGVTHSIQTTKMTDTTKVTNDGLEKMVFESNCATTTAYEATTDGKDTGTETTTISENTVRTTQYYYGIGYDWSKNVSFDILGLSGYNPLTGSANILDISQWRISCVLKF
ncbi:MAG: hypothetical protein ABID79_06220, partial [Elusimicrobiota bacterium]